VFDTEPFCIDIGLQQLGEVREWSQCDMVVEARARPKLGFIISLLGAILLLFLGFLVFLLEPIGIVNLVLGCLIIVGAILAHYRGMKFSGGMTTLLSSVGSIPLIVIYFGVVLGMFSILGIAGGVLILLKK